MKKSRLVLILGVIGICLLFASNVFAFDWDWKAYETENFVIFYPEGYEHQAYKTSYYLEKHRDDILDLTGNNRDVKTHVVVQDVGLITNGYANPMSVKVSIFTTNPPTGSILDNTQDWLELVSVHEFTHIAQMTNYSGMASLPADLFGNLFAPNIYSPNWVIEGITVYKESSLNKYDGRLNAGYYDGVVANKAQNGKLPSILEANYHHNHYPRGQHYLYGGEFFRYLAEEYGEEKLGDYFQLYGSYHWAPIFGSIFPAVGVDLAAEEVFGKPFPELFSDWKDYEREKYSNWSPGGEVVKETKRGEISNLISAGDKLYYLKHDTLTPYPYVYSQQGSVVEYNPAENEEKAVTSLPGSSYGSLQLVNNELYYSVYNLESDYPNVYLSGRGVTGGLYSYNLSTGREEKIFTDRVRNFSVLPSGEIIYVKDKEGKFGSQIWRYSQGQKEKLADTDQLISELTYYQDELIAVSKKETGSWNLNYLSLPEAELTSIVSTPWSEKNVKVKGDKLYFTANYNHKPAVYQYDLITEQVKKVSSGDYAEGGVPNQGQLYYVSLTPEGKALYQAEVNSRDYKLPEEEVILEVPDFSDQELERKNSFGKNLSYLFKPYIRFTPYLAAGEDALGLNSYIVSYGSQGIDFQFTSQMLQPLSISVVNTAEFSGRDTNLTLSYPVYQSLENGLSQIQLDYRTDFEDSIPAVKASLSYPRQTSTVKVENNINTGGVNTEVSYRYLLDEGRIKLSGNAVEEFDTEREVRGFWAERENATGYQLSLDCSRKLFELRGGFWNPNIFFGDVYGSVFVDHAELDSPMTAYGYEFSVEMGSFFSLSAAPRIGVAYTEDGEQKNYISIESNF